MIVLNAVYIIEAHDELPLNNCNSCNATVNVTPLEHKANPGDSDRKYFVCQIPPPPP